MELSKNGIAPRCLYTSPEFRIEEFVDGARHEYCGRLLGEEGLLRVVMRKVADLHKVQMSEAVPRNVLVHDMFNGKNEQVLQ